jgi:hypothetical protein
MWDIREPVNVIDDTGTRCIMVTACVRNLLIPYMLHYRMSDGPMFSSILFERDALPGPDGYAVYRRVRHDMAEGTHQDTRTSEA